MTDLGLRPEFWDLVQEHAEFFKTESRRDALRVRFAPENSHNVVRTKMLAVCTFWA